MKTKATLPLVVAVLVLVGFVARGAFVKSGHTISSSGPIGSAPSAPAEPSVSLQGRRAFAPISHPPERPSTPPSARLPHKLADMELSPGVETALKKMEDDFPWPAQFRANLDAGLELRARIDECTGGEVKEGSVRAWFHYTPSPNGKSLILDSVKFHDGGGFESQDIAKMVIACVNTAPLGIVVPIVDPGAAEPTSAPVRIKFPVSSNGIYEFLKTGVDKGPDSF